MATGWNDQGRGGVDIYKGFVNTQLIWSQQWEGREGGREGAELWVEITQSEAFSKQYLRD